MSNTPTKDRINIDAIRIMAYCGNLPEEQERRQPFDISLGLAVDIRSASASDELENTVDYVWIIEEINKYFEVNKIKLIERMAQIVADIVLTNEHVQEVDVTIKKLHPPVSRPIGSAGIQITRSRN